jgi:Cof subfamily protein (haloacid dehalogenase superfamily)
MGKFDGILICTDVDGTLLNSNNIISDKNKEAIEYFKDNGGLFTFVTGRVPITAKQICDMVNPNAPYGCINGGGVYDHINNKFLQITTVPECIFEFADYVHNIMPDMGIQVNTSDNIYTTVFNDAMQWFYDITGIEKKFKNYNEITEPIVKIIFAHNDEKKINNLAKILDEHPLAKQFDFIRSEKILYEILPKNIHKGVAVKNLCRILNVDINKTIAVGDYDNDVGMLKTAKIGIAVANASQKAKDAADIVTVSNDEHAIAKIIYDLDNGKLII